MGTFSTWLKAKIFQCNMYVIFGNPVPKQSFSPTEDCAQYGVSQTSAGGKFNNLLRTQHSSSSTTFWSENLLQALHLGILRLCAELYCLKKVFRPKCCRRRWMLSSKKIVKLRTCRSSQCINKQTNRSHSTATALWTSGIDLSGYACWSIGIQ